MAENEKEMMDCEMKSARSISSSVLFPFIHTVRSLGLDERPLFQECGLEPSILSSAANRITPQQYDRLIKTAVLLSGDASFGLRLGNAFGMGSGGVVTYMIQNCQTLHEAITKYIEYQAIVGDSIRYNLSVLKTDAWLTISVIDPALQNNRYLLEAEVAAIRKIGQELLVSTLVLNEVRFASTEPDSIDVYREAFGCPIRWNQEQTALLLDRTTLSLPLKQPNPELLQLLERQALAFLKRITEPASFADVAMRHIRSLDLSAGIRMEQVVRMIPISVRGLQMKLKAEGTTFQTLLDEVRREIAESQLREGLTTITAIAHSLGYSEPSVFQKAFKKWTGMSPGEYRKGGGG